MKACLFITLAALFGHSAFATTADADREIRVIQIQHAVSQACALPAVTKPYSRYALDRYTSQTEFSDLKMLSTAFLVGFEAMESQLLEYGYCVIVFMGLPNDPTWEPSFNFYEKAESAGRLPKQMFGGFNAHGDIVLKAVEKLN